MDVGDCHGLWSHRNHSRIDVDSRRDSEDGLRLGVRCTVCHFWHTGSESLDNGVIDGLRSRDRRDLSVVGVGAQGLRGHGNERSDNLRGVELGDCKVDGRIDGSDKRTGVVAVIGLVLRWRLLNGLCGSSTAISGARSSTSRVGKVERRLGRAGSVQTWKKNLNSALDLSCRSMSMCG